MKRILYTALCLVINTTQIFSQESRTQIKNGRVPLKISDTRRPIKQPKLIATRQNPNLFGNSDKSKSILKKSKPIPKKAPIALNINEEIKSENKASQPQNLDVSYLMRLQKLQAAAEQQEHPTKPAISSQVVPVAPSKIKAQQTKKASTSESPSNDDTQAATSSFDDMEEAAQFSWN